MPTGCNSEEDEEIFVVYKMW